MTTDNKNAVEKFSRYEFKYILNEELKNKVEDQIRHFMKYDGYVHPELDNSYFVRSLYFDSPKSFNFYEKIDGIKKRKKFRLRTYDKQFGNSSIFIEQKGRNVNRVFKHRTRVEQDHIKYFYDGMNFEHLVRIYKDMNIINEFVSDTVKRKIEPVVLVDYVRCPYISDYDMNFRVTFDSNIKAKASRTLHPDTDNSLDCLSGYTILEVKFSERYQHGSINLF